MDDWDAFDPDLHAALNASLTPPAATGMMPSIQITQPAGSETTVQSAQQVHAPQGQPQATPSQPSVQASTFQSRVYGTVPIYAPVQTGTAQVSGTPQGIPMFPSVHQAQTSAQQMSSPSAGNNGDAVDSTTGSDVTFRPVGAGGSSSGPNGGGSHPVVAIPTGPRYLQDLVAVEGRTLRRSPRMPALPLAPHWAPCSIVLPSLADCSPGLPGTRVGRRRVKVHACRSSLQSVKRSACSRCRLHAVLEKTINKQERTRTMNKGTSTLLSISNVLRTAVRPRAALPPFTVQSSMSPPTT